MCNQYCSEAITITKSECVFVALGIQRPMRMRHIVLWPFRLYNIFPHYLTNGTIFEKLSEIRSKMYIGLHKVLVILVRL